MAHHDPRRPVSPIGPDWQRRIARFLDEGEEMLWAGQPDKTMAMVRNLPLLGGIGIVLVVLFAGVAWLSWGAIRQGQLGAILPLAILFLAMLCLPLAMFWQRWRAGKTCYALTSRRAMVFQPSVLGKLRVVSYRPRELGNVQFERSRWFGSKAGDWVFKKHVTKHVRRTIDERSPLPDRVEVSYSVKKYGFLMLRDALAIETLLREVARGETGPPD